MDIEAYRAATAGAALFNRVRGLVAVAGNDRRGYLHAMLTNDVASLSAGRGCYAAYLTPQGRMMADMRVIDLGDVVLLDLPPEVADTVIQTLDRFVFSEDVELGNVTDAFAVCSVVGPEAASAVAAVIDADAAACGTADELRQWPEFQNARASHRGQLVLVVASRELGVPGIDLLVERPHAEALRAGLLSAGVVPGDETTVEILRVEAGRPAFGIDMDQQTIPLEAGIEGRAISFTKGCYPGQEVIIRLVHRGQGRVARRLVVLDVQGDAVPSRGDRVEVGDREAGPVTSAVFSPKHGAPTALAMLHRDFTAPGTTVAIVHEQQMLQAVVRALA